MSKCNITAKELSEALEISVERLLEICDFFDSDPDDNWTLTVNEHFVWGNLKTRNFSPEGAIEICNYLEANHQERPIYTRFTRWLTRRDAKLKKLMIAKKFQEFSEVDGQIVYRNGTAFLAPRACREILKLGNRQDLLSGAFRDIQLGDPEIEPLIKGEEFFDYEDLNPAKKKSTQKVKSEDDASKKKEELLYHYVSGTALAKIGKRLHSRLTQQHRKQWMETVVTYVPLVLCSMEDYEKTREKRITDAKNQVRNQAKGRCQLTNKRQAVGQFKLDVHHLFSQAAYPHLADKKDNLIAIQDRIHDHFHKWMGGKHVPCTPADMERFVEEFGASLFDDTDESKNIAQALNIARRLSEARKSLEPLAKKNSN